MYAHEALPIYPFQLRFLKTASVSQYERRFTRYCKNRQTPFVYVIPSFVLCTYFSILKSVHNLCPFGFSIVYVFQYTEIRTQIVYGCVWHLSVCLDFARPQPVYVLDFVLWLSVSDFQFLHLHICVSQTQNVCTAHKNSVYTVHNSTFHFWHFLANFGDFGYFHNAICTLMKLFQFILFS